MNLENAVLSEVKVLEKNQIVWAHLYVESKIVEIIDTGYKAASFQV